MCKDLGNNQFECQGNCNSNSTIWGTGLYTADSNVYQVAKHMGITPGRFKKVMVAGAQTYLGSVCNGISSTNYGTYPNSFFLVPISGVNSTVVQCNGGVSEQSLTNVKNELQVITQNECNKLKAQIDTLKNQFNALTLAMTEELKKSQEKACQKETKMILNALKKDCSICAICMDNERSRVVFPCFHASYCEECIKAVREKQECSICQGKITGDIRIIL